jgi:hypothetical protein
MSDRRTVVKSGIVALALAIAIIAGTILTGVSPLTQQLPSQAQQGTLAILLTDPPNLPLGVTAVYIEYSNLAVHVSHAGNESGWYSISSSGIIDLMGVLNMSQTIGSAKIPSGIYNVLRFNVSSANVTYNDANYTAFVSNSEITVPIVGGVKVNSSQLSAALIDIYPTIFNIGNSTNPEFVMSAVARAVQVPSNEILQEMGIERKGHLWALEGRAWWKNFEEEYSININITDASLSSNFLSVTVQNMGNENIQVQEVVITPYQMFPVSEWNSHGGNDRGPKYIPQLLGGAVFFTNSSGDLESLKLPTFNNPNFPPFNKPNPGHYTEDMRTQLIPMIGQLGYELPVGSSVTLTYSGSILLLPMQPFQNQSGIVSGDQYVITVIGRGATARTVVTAG